jgi:hypothetical protein
VKSGVKDKQNSSSSSSGFSTNSGVGGSGSKYTNSKEGSVRGGGLFGSLFGNNNSSSSSRAIAGTPNTSAATSSSSLSTSYEAAAAALGLQLEPAEVTAAVVPPPPPPTTATTPSTVPAVPLETVPEVIVLPRSASEGGAALAARLAALKQEQLNKLLRANFTAAHNSGSAKDSGSAFLGDELSVHNRNAFGAVFARSNSSSTSSSSTSSSSGISSGAYSSFSSSNGQRATVAQPLAPAATEPVLLSVAECAHWSAAPGCASSSSSRDATAQHWIVPAVIAGFPTELLPLALQSASRVPLCVDNSSSDNGSSNSTSSSATAIDWFQCYELGSALVTSRDSSGTNSTSNSGSSSKPILRWLLLRQNYLFEYAVDHCTDTDTAAPLGYVNLSKATVRYDAAVEPLVVHVAAPQTPVQSSATLQLVLQASTAAAAQQWAAVLQQAAVLCMDTLYEQLPAIAEGADQMKRSASKANLEVCTFTSNQQKCASIDERMYPRIAHTVCTLQ